MNLSLNFLENLLLITSSFSAKTPENSKGPQREMNHLPTAEWGEHVSCEECNYEKISWTGPVSDRPGGRRCDEQQWVCLSTVSVTGVSSGNQTKRYEQKSLMSTWFFLFTSLGKFCCGVFRCRFPQSAPKSRWKDLPKNSAFPSFLVCGFGKGLWTNPGLGAQ